MYKNEWWTVKLIYFFKDKKLPFYSSWGFYLQELIWDFFSGGWNNFLNDLEKYFFITHKIVMYWST